VLAATNGCRLCTFFIALIRSDKWKLAAFEVGIIQLESMPRAIPAVEWKLVSEHGAVYHSFHVYPIPEPWCKSRQGSE
jgi:hypothetical protein